MNNPKIITAAMATAITNNFRNTRDGEYLQLAMNKILTYALSRDVNKMLFSAKGITDPDGFVRFFRGLGYTVSYFSAVANPYFSIQWDCDDQG
jgi:hypothetical protein